MSYEVYRNRNSSDEDFHLIADMYERVMREDKVLCDNAQKNLDRKVFSHGQMHPVYEKAPLFFQSTVRDVIAEHFDKEKEAGAQIWPARRKPCDSQGEKDEEIASALGVGCNLQREALAW